MCTHYVYFTLVMYYFSCPRCCCWATGSYGLLWRYCLWWYSFEELTVCSVYCSHLSKLVCCIDMQVHVLQGSPTGFVQSFTDISWLIYQRTKFNINAYESNGCKYVHSCCTNHFSYFSDCLALYFLSKFLITVEPLLSGPLLSADLFYLRTSFICAPLLLSGQPKSIMWFVVNCQ